MIGNALDMRDDDMAFIITDTESIRMQEISREMFGKASFRNTL
jgi:hypothetical protein